MTQGKDAAAAKELELAGWDYPKHLAGRAFAVVAHGDASGPENLRRILADWLTDGGLVQAGPSAVLDTFIGYYQPYATSHQALDRDEGFQEEVRNAARALVKQVQMMRAGRREPDEELEEPRKK